MLMLFGIPLYVTFENISLLVLRKGLFESEIGMEVISLVLGPLCIWGYIEFTEIHRVEWYRQLQNNQRHFPVSNDGTLTILVLAVLGYIGYLILKYQGFSSLPPLVIVLGISFVYIGIALAVVVIVQVFTVKSTDFLLSLFPLNYILIGLKVIRNSILDWKDRECDKENSKLGSKINKLSKSFHISKNWLWLGFIFMVPVLGIVVLTLTLFGQRPDSMILAWTKTSDWNLSQHVAPPNVQIDEHYLCTVAASGHRKIVKPYRMGIRHDHRVIVNRQLCVANAFEQILEEKIPRIHKIIRTVYDNYGYPIAKKIKSPYVADIIYYLMKPAEYFFLLIIYLFDAKPENRIAMQYISKIK
ncbi:DUF6688 family protein [Enterococcus gilvus]|uniref:DUF6688 domain-containing protein n=1 Tax=Enterococcus gilvus TaxID=160453 RepID=UPI00289351E7|nr:DUF6688 family protein [Enterococcus gilvus]